MLFTVPQFIEREAKIVGPLTFKQFIFIGAAGAICFILYFSIAKKNFFLFLVLSIFILGIGITLAFLKINGRGLPTILVSFLRFNLAPKIYIWKQTPIPFLKTSEFKKEVSEEELPLKNTKRDQLKKLETKSK